MNYYELDKKAVSAASEILRSITHPLRLSIIILIDSKVSINVHDIYSSLGLEQSITSQHLKILRDSSIVKFNRKGKQIFYSLNYPRIKAVSTSVDYFDLLTKERQKKKKKQAVDSGDAVAA